MTMMTTMTTTHPTQTAFDLLSLDGLGLDGLGYLAALLAGGGMLILTLGLRQHLMHARLDARLQTFVDAASPPAADLSGPRPSLRVRLGPLLSWVARRVGNALPNRAIERMRANLSSAGFPAGRDLTNFLAAKALLAVLLALPGPVLLLQGSGSASLAVLLTVIGAAVGFYLPGIWLGRRIGRRRQEITRALPDALDLLSISVSAGLGFEGALNEVVQRWQNPLTEELATAQRDMRVGKSRREALRALADRTGVPDVSGFVTAVVQAEELGTPMRDALRMQSEQMRLQRSRRAEERARKAVIKMLIPMVLFIFPAIFIVLLGPALPSLTALGK